MKSLSDKAGILIALNGFKYAVGFIVPAILVRLLTKEDYGTYQQLLLLGTAAVGIMTLGIPSSIYYFYEATNPGRRQALVIQTLGALLVSGTLTAIAVFIFRDNFGDIWNSSTIPDLLPTYCFYLVFFIASEHLIHFLISQDRYVTGVKVQGGETIVRAAILVFPVLMGAGLEGLVISIAAYAFARFVVYTFLLRSELLPLNRSLADNWFLKEQVAYSFPLAFSSLVGLIGRLLDRLLISLNFSASQFAVYAVGALEIPLDVIFQNSVANVLRASLPSLVREGRYSEVVRVWRASVRKLALVVIPAFFFLMGFAEDFIVTLYTTNYSDSVDVFRIYLLLVPLHMFVLSLLPQVFGKTKVSLQITFVAVGTNVIMSLVLLKTIGYYGPAIATVLSSYLAAGLFFAIACRLLCCSVKDLLPAVEIVKMTIVTGITTGLSLLILSGLDSPFLRLMVGFPIYCAIYVVGGILAGMFTSEDKRLIRKWTVDLVMTRK